MDKEDESGGTESTSTNTSRSTSQENSSNKDPSNVTSLDEEPAAANQVQDIVENPEAGGGQEYPTITDTLPHGGSSTSGTNESSRASFNAVKEMFSPKYLPTTVAMGCLVMVAAFAVFQANRLGHLRTTMNQKQLESAIDMFPKNPLEYNIRQRMQFIESSNSMWRRFNFRAIGALGACVTVGATLKLWHRKRRTMILRRKSLFFWAFTTAAAFLLAFWGGYMMKRGTATQQIVQQIRRNPFLRAIVYLAMIMTVGLLLMMGRIFLTKPKKHRRAFSESQTMRL